MPFREPSLRPLFRETLETFLPDYLRLVEPDSASHLHLDCITFPEPGRAPRWTEGETPQAGVIAQVPSRWSETVTVVVQVEPLALAPAELASRLGRIFMDLEIHYCQPVLLNVIYLRGGRPGINLETAPVCRVFGLDVLRLYFTAFGLEGSRAEYYLERPEPISWALSALMPPLRHSRERHRELCLERIATAGLEAQRSALLKRFVAACAAEEPAKRR
jgi:hypothetical protein